MRIGVFDSGLGGLGIARAIMERLPEYDYLYLGDTKRVPYGNRSQQTIHEFTAQALNFLFGNECQIIILACNTASAESLRKSQQEYLPQNYPDRRVLGVIIPAVEAAAEAAERKVGVIATASTIESGAYLRELNRQCPRFEVVQNPAPLLVPVIENDGLKYLEPILADYLEPLQTCKSLILGCTHYCLIKEQVRKLFRGTVISQDEVVPEKLADYLARHPEHDGKLAKRGQRRYCVTDLTGSYRRFAHRLMDQEIELELVAL
ncbi:MAG: glutamate racemase [Armatimonadetes bacterium]|nr:glutamate racemase [Armatimonadota bacterium]